MSEKNDCRECERLREAYANAVFACVRFESQMKIAALPYGDGPSAELVKRVGAALANRNLALRKFQEHKTTHPLMASAT
jgi:molybdenum cofactor biosynthesis enzyme MoaA